MLSMSKSRPSSFGSSECMLRRTALPASRFVPAVLSLRALEPQRTNRSPRSSMYRCTSLSNGGIRWISSTTTTVPFGTALNSPAKRPMSANNDWYSDSSRRLIVWAFGNVILSQVLFPVPRGPKRKKDPLGGARRRGYICVDTMPSLCPELLYHAIQITFGTEQGAGNRPLRGEAGSFPGVARGFGPGVQDRGDRGQGARELLPDDTEVRLAARGDGPAAGEIFGQRIQELAVPAEAEIQVGSGREPRRADLADDVPLPDLRPPPDPLRDAGEVPVGSRVPVRVPDDHEVPVRTLVPGEDHGAVPHGGNRGARRRRVVHTEVGPRDLQDRVDPSFRETGGDPPVAQRRLQERFPQRFPLVVEVGRPVPRVEAVRPVHVAVHGEFRREDVAVIPERAVEPPFLHQDPERIPLPEIRVEVDVPGEDVGELDRQQHRFAAPGEGGDDIRPDDAAQRSDPPLVFDRHLVGPVAGLRADDPQDLLVVDVVGEGEDVIVRIESDRVRPSLGNVPEPGDARGGLPHPEQFAEVQVVLFEDRRHGFALADRVGDLAQPACPRVDGSAGRPRIPHDGVAEEQGEDHGAENRGRDDQFLSHASIPPSGPAPARANRSCRWMSTIKLNLIHVTDNAFIMQIICVTSDISLCVRRCYRMEGRPDNMTGRQLEGGVR